MKNILSIILLFVLLSCPVVCAEDINFLVTVDRNTVELGSSLQLTLTIQGTQSFSPIKLPGLEGFDSRYLGPSTRLSIVNGRTSASISFIYNLYPTKIGSLEIPAFFIKYEGREYKTDPIKIQVVDQAGVSQTNSGITAPDVQLSDKIFLQLSAPKERVFLGEKIPIHIRLYVSNLQVRYQYPELPHEGFSLEDYQESQKYQTILSGVPFEVVEFTAFVYPVQTGSLAIGPAREVCDIVSRSKSSRPGGFGSIFDEDFFQGFFETYDTRPVTLESNKVQLEVLPLPAAGRPQDFTGAVGEFNFALTVSPQKVKVGDPLTVKMRVSGEGNVKAIQMPSLKDQGIDEDLFKIYEPEIREEEGRKVLEQVVIPKSGQVQEFPPIQFSYFDVNKKEYVTKTQGPFPLTVEKLAASEKMHVVGLAPDTSGAEEEHLGRDIVFIKNLPGHLQPVGFNLYKNTFFLVIVGLVFFIWLFLYSAYRLTHKIRTDEKFARRLLAPRKAKKELASARICLGRAQKKEFYDTLFKMLLGYLGNKFHMSPGSITLAEIEGFIRSRRGKPDSVMMKIQDVFEQCEMVRFAAMELDRQKMESCYAKAQEIIDYFERL